MIHASPSASSSSAASSAASSILMSLDEPTFLKGGYYSRTVHNGKIVILSLNTLLYSSFHDPYTHHRDTKDPGEQFAWMGYQLSKCRSTSTSTTSTRMTQQAILVGHVPPVMGSYRHQQLWIAQYIHSYYDIVTELMDLIMAQ